MARADYRRRGPLLSLVAAMGALLLGQPTSAQESLGPDPASSQEPEGEEAVGLASPDPRDEDPEFVEPDALLFGNLGPYRAKVREIGLTYDLQWTQHLQGVVDGGKDTGLAYGGGVDYAIDLNLDQMGVLPGASVSFLAESRYGESSNPDAGTIMPVNTDMGFPLTRETDDDIALTITQLTYTQFLHEGFGFFVGKLQTLDGDLNEFASGRGRNQFQNAIWSSTRSGCWSFRTAPWASASSCSRPRAS